MPKSFYYQYLWGRQAVDGSYADFVSRIRLSNDKIRQSAV